MRLSSIEVNVYIKIWYSGNIDALFNLILETCNEECYTKWTINWDQGGCMIQPSHWDQTNQRIIKIL